MRSKFYQFPGSIFELKMILEPSKMAYKLIF